MEIFKPNKWNILGATIGTFSGLLLALGFLGGGDLPAFSGLAFGIFSLFLLSPLLKFTHLSSVKINVWLFFWLVSSGLSWFASLCTLVFLSEEIESLIVSVISASTLGVTILFLAFTPIVRGLRLKLYLTLLCVSTIVSISAVSLSGGEFDGLLDGNLDIIHPLWQASMLYIFSSVLFHQSNKIQLKNIG